MSYANQRSTTSGYEGSLSQIVITDKVLPAINLQIRAENPLGRMANWNAAPIGTLVAGGKVKYQTTGGLAVNEVCEGFNGAVTTLSRRFNTAELELCANFKFTIKDSKEDLQRRVLAINEGVAAGNFDAVMQDDMTALSDQLTIPFALMKLIGSADPSGVGLGAVGIPFTAGVAAGLGDLNNPIKVDVTSARNGGNLIQTGSLSTKALISRLKQNMIAKGVTAMSKNLMLSGSGGLEAGFSADGLCADSCALLQTNMQYNITSWMPYAYNAAGQRVDYVTLHDPKDFWFTLYTLYMSYKDYTHDAEIGGMWTWGAKVNRAKTVSVAAVQFV